MRGIEGYGASSRVHTASILRLSQDLPVIVEPVDKPDRIIALLPTIAEMVQGGIITTEEIDVVKYSRSSK